MPGKPKMTVHRIPITEARINLGQVARRAHLNGECFILEKDGIPIAGIIDVDELEDYHNEDGNPRRGFAIDLLRAVSL